MNAPQALLYFVKWPEPGKVKTRLAKVVGDEQAAIIYRKLAFDNFNKVKVLQSKQMQCVVYFDPPQHASDIESWLTGADVYLAQKGEGLGERIAYGFAQAFQSGAQVAMALGSDTLRFEFELIHQAMRLLEYNDVVIGPAADGGFYLLALKQQRPELFQKVAWSTPTVFQTLVDRLKKENKKTAFLETLHDLDEESDLLHL